MRPAPPVRSSFGIRRKKLIPAPFAQSESSCGRKNPKWESKPSIADIILRIRAVKRTETLQTDRQAGKQAGVTFQA